jgi:flagellin
MSGIVLSSSVRQNLLSLQSTADLLATTQNRLATGKKVNTALDNPTNFFTATALDARASDINNLLDGIGSGVQVLQAANTGITSLQKLVDSAKSVANQALQTTVGYSAKSSVSVNINGATADNILGTGAPIDGTVDGTAALNNQAPVYTANTANGTAITALHQTAWANATFTGAAVLNDDTGGAVAITGGTNLAGAAGAGSDNLATNITAADSITVNGTIINFNSGGGTSGSATAGTLDIDVTISDVDDILTAIDAITGASGPTASTVSAGGELQLSTGVTSTLTITGTANLRTALGLGAGVTQARSGGVSSTPTATAATRLSGPAIAGGADALQTAFTAADYIVANGKTISFNSGNGTTGSIGANDLSIDITTGTLDTVLDAIDAATGGTGYTINAGVVTLSTSTTSDVALSGTGLAKLGVGFSSITRNSTGGPSAITGLTLLSGASTTTSDALSTSFAAGDTVTVNGQNITFVASGASGNTQINITDDVETLLTKIDLLSGATPSSSSVTAGVATLHTGTTSDLTVSSSNTAALAALGFTSPVTATRGTGPSPLNGLSLNIASTGGGVATALTFGSGTGQVKTLNDLNNALAANNLQATLASDGALTITTSNDAASSTIGSITGSATFSGALFNGTAGSTPVADAAATATRNNFVTQYNNILNQITTTSQDASFNGVNLLSGDTLKLTFNETGKSTLSIAGVNFNSSGLGLASLANGDFKDNEAVQKVVSALNTASSTLRSQASAFGSNLSIVQIRQDFSKNLINVLQTGSSNLTLADTNEEAANSQALATRQSIAVSALALANQSQQSVLQLLR